jgi:hypothetical protein
MSRERLAARQAELVASLVAGADAPPGFDERLLTAARKALLRKRAGEAASAWPRLAASLGPQWTATFSGFAAGRPPVGALRDGWDLARSLANQSELAPVAAEELRGRERRWRYDGVHPPRRRRYFALKF